MHRTPITAKKLRTSPKASNTDLYREVNQVATISIVSTIFVGSVITMPIVNTQNNVSSSQIQNTKKLQMQRRNLTFLIFGQRIVGNIDNSTKIVSSVVGNNLR